MDNPSMASPNITLKLLVDKRAQQVVFAEATKEFVDMLFHIFSLPLGSLIEFVGSKHMVGSLGKLKDSVELFSQECYLQPDIDKDDIFNRKPAFDRNIFPLLNDAFANDKPVASNPLYICSFDPFSKGLSDSYYGAHCCGKYMSVIEYASCPECRRSMNVPLKSFRPSNDGVAKAEPNTAYKLMRGYVKEKVSYMVMDNLEVKPMSSTTLINSFSCKDFSQLEEKSLLFGKNEALKLVKASLMTDHVLTTLYRLKLDA